MNYQNQNKKSCLIQIEHLFHCSIYPTNNAMVSLKVGFTVWCQSLKEEFSSIINYINVWLSLMTGHGANPIFFNKKNKDWMSRTLPDPPPTMSNNILFLPYPLLPLTPKIDVICVSLPFSVSTIKLIIISKFRTLKFWINNRLIFLFWTFIECGNSFRQWKLMGPLPFLKDHRVNWG